MKAPLSKTNAELDFGSFLLLAPRAPDKHAAVLLERHGDSARCCLFSTVGGLGVDGTTLFE